MKKLLFIDTNILLDFYRERNDVSKKLVEHIEKTTTSLICTYQLEMEFKKNRQAAILEGSNTLRAPGTIPRPGILSDDRSYQALAKDIAKASKRINALQARLARVLEDPIRNDPVFKVLQRIFKKQDDLSLHRGTPTAHRIRRLALKRFLLGYPPRKRNDTSTGDSVNWEWIIDCASRQTADVLVVSRDGDYGVIRDGKGHINDWLREEFRDRVSKKATIRLTPLLSEALKEFNVPVSRMVTIGERSLIKTPKSSTSGSKADFASRLHSSDQSVVEQAVDERIADTIYDLIEADELSTEIAGTNATGWMIDDYEVNDIDTSAEPAEVKVTFSASGDQLDDKPFAGTSLSGSATAQISDDGSVEFTDIEVSRDEEE